MRNKRQTGFTLIELLVVIAIIGLLASVVLLSLNSAREKSRNAKRLADVRQIASALELYFNDCGSYPIQTVDPIDSTRILQAGSGTAVTTTAPCGANDASGATPNGAGGIRTASGGTGTVYLGQFPTSPNPADGTCTTAQNTYDYVSASANTYTLNFCLGSITGSYAAGARTLTPSGIQ